MKRIILTFTILTLVTLNAFSAVNPCNVNPELCEPPKEDCKQKGRQPTSEPFTKHSAGGTSLPSSISIMNLSALFDEIKKGHPGNSTIKSIVATKPNSPVGAFDVLYTNNCTYSYDINIEYSDLGTKDIYTAVLKGLSCVDK